MKLQLLLSYVRKACDDYGMIQDGDKIAVGISGGKDSLTLLLALKNLQRFYPAKFELVAITVSLGLPGFDTTEIRAFSENLGVPYYLVETDIGEITMSQKNPCSLCAKMRKGALNDKAVELGCNKVALGHNKDDVVETFLLSLFYEGRFHVFSPVTYWDRKNIHSIRPLSYVPEKDIISFKNKNQLPVLKNPCSVDGHTKRAEVKNLVKEYNERFGNFDEKLFGAIRREGLDGWKI